MCAVCVDMLMASKKKKRQADQLRDTGNLKSLNELAKQARADHIIHTGDFGFYDDTSLERIADK
jgi:hypothetical protein